MRRKPAHQVVTEKREWHYQPKAEEKAQGFKGWYSRGYLPHFDAPGVWQFITYRLADSVPYGLSHKWNEATKLEDSREKFRRMDLVLDRGHGACHLRQSHLAQMVQDNLWFHDGQAYRLLAWVIMPNHLHVLAEMWKPLGGVLRNWKSYTSNEANRWLGNVNESFWQADYFDHYIRDQEHYRTVVRYIENNPVKARLVPEPAQWQWSSARFRGHFGSDEFPKIPKSFIEDSAERNEILSGARTALSARDEESQKRADKAVHAPGAL
jgi:putative DNA methylase